MKKSEALHHWSNLPEGQDPLKHMAPIPYKSEGSRYGACGVRIDGNPQFIDAVLSRLKPLLDGENQVTRLELARNEVKDTEIHGERRGFSNRDRSAEVCYIRLHMRGGEAVMASAFFDKHLSGATERFEQSSIYAR